MRCSHFIGFRGEEYWSAVRVWGARGAVLFISRYYRGYVMLYIVQTTRNGHDYYGFDCKVKGVAFVDARSKSQARRLAREKLLIAGCGGIKIGRALYAEGCTNEQRLELCIQLKKTRRHT